MSRLKNFINEKNYLIEGGQLLDTKIKASSEKKFRQKFSEMQDKDRQMYGMDPYSGSWATIDNLKVVSMPSEFEGRKFTKKMKQELIDHFIDKINTNDAIAVPVSGGYFVFGMART